MHKQTKADKMNESLGMRRGKESTKKQSMPDRRHESEGASHDHHSMAMHHHKEMHKHLKKMKKK